MNLKNSLILNFPTDHLVMKPTRMAYPTMAMKTRKSAMTGMYPSTDLLPVHI